MHGRTLAVCGSLLFAACAAVGACSLDLNEHLLDNPKLESVPDSSLDGEPPNDGNDGHLAGLPVDCATDDACTTDNGCLKGRCDVARKRCVYDVCRPSACNAGVCDRATKTCSQAAPYKLNASQFSLGSRIACARCAAAVHSWLFVATTDGLVAFDVSNPASTAPPRVPVVGLAFVPVAMVQSGNRVWLLGNATGDGPSRLPIAYIDPPTDPLADKITAETVLTTYSRKSETIGLFPRGGDSVLLLGETAPVAAAFAEAPLVEPVTLSAFPFTMTANFGPSAMSGKRLFMSAVVNQAASFYLIDAVGTAAAVSDPVSNPTGIGAVSTQRVFAQGDDGTVFWATGAHQGSGIGITTRAARGYFLVSGETAPVDGSAGVDIEVYPTAPVANAPIFGGNPAGAAMLDANTVMIAMQAHENALQTAVAFVTKSPLALVTEAGGTTPRRQVLPVLTNDIVAAAGSGGVGYLIANGATPTAPSAVFVIDPACAP
jgi:hypothetical protein